MLFPRWCFAAVIFIATFSAWLLFRSRQISLPLHSSHPELPATLYHPSHRTLPPALPHELKQIEKKPRRAPSAKKEALMLHRVSALPTTRQKPTPLFPVIHLAPRSNRSRAAWTESQWNNIRRARGNLILGMRPRLTASRRVRSESGMR